MRRHPLTWFFVLALCAAAFFLFQHAWNSSKVKVPASARSGPSSVGLPSGHNVSTNALKAAIASSVTNRFPWRLSNTDKPIAKLAHDPNAILLENAFIDTSAKINFTIPKNLLAQGDPGAYVVQARGATSPEFRSALTAAGAKIVSYIPNNAYLVQATQPQANGLSDNPLVQVVIPYEPYYKVQAPLLAMADKPLPASVQLNLGLFPGDAAATIGQIQQLGGLIVSQQNSEAGYTIVSVEPPRNWTALAGLQGVHVVEPSHGRSLANDLARWALGISADPVTATNYMNLYGSNVLVEMNDGGVDTNHPDFSNGGAGPIRAFGFGTNSPDNGHATHVAGIIAGDGFESTTVTNASGSPMPGTNGQFRGKAPFAKLLSVNFLDDEQTLQETPAENGALISNNSWVFGDDFDYDLEAASFDAATRDALPFTPGAQPVLFVFAAGNDGSSGIPGTVDSPGTAKDLITVGALEELRNITNQVTNSDGTMSTPWQGETDDPTAVPGFSGCGNVGIGTEGTFGRFKPDVVAPGTFEVSLRSSGWDTNAYYHPTNDNISIFPDLIPTNSTTLAPFDFFVPTNSVNVIFLTETNAGSPTPFPPVSGLPIYVSTNGGPYTLIGTNFANIFEPAASAVGTNWSVEVSNTTSSTITYNLFVDVQTTNWMGNYYDVLQGMNDTLGTEPEYYRYETGTSMSAAAISGFLADMEDYFTNQLGEIPSPALLKAMTINGARVTGQYDFQVQNSINFEGWGLPDLSNSVPIGITNSPLPGDLNDPSPPTCSLFFRDQNLTNALATGDSETFTVTVNTNDDAQFEPLRITLAWTDPPGDPTAGIKLVNDLELVVTDLDNPGIVYYGNDIGPGAIYNTPESVSNSPVIDNINNVQNVFIGLTTLPFIDTHYSVTVSGLAVNVNAVTEATNNDVQDFALVISSGDMSETTDAVQVVDGGVVSNPSGAQTITIGQTNTILLNQTAGANTPLLGTNTIDLTTNSQFTVGMTNEWHFYIVTNTTTFTNAAFITFGATTLATPRMGVFADSDANSTVQPGPDLDLLVTRSSTDLNAQELTNLWLTEVSNCVLNASGDGSSLVSGGTDFVAYTNALPNEVFYIGVKSENHMAVQYGFIPIFSQNPFSGNDTNGNAYLNGLNVPSPIPDGTPANPGISRVFMLDMNPIEIQNVIITNIISHQNFGDLVGSITHNGTTVVLNNHDLLSVPPPPGPYTNIYDDSGQGTIPGSKNSDGPGSLRNFDGTSGQGVWILTEEGTALVHTGEVLSVSAFLQKHQDPQNGVNVELEPGEWFYDFVDVPVGITNLQIFGTNLTDTVGLQPIQMFLLEGAPPTATDFDFEALLTNGVSPGPLGNEISDGPPLAPDVYWIGLFNPNAIGTVAQDVFLIAVLNGPASVAQPTAFTATNSTPLLIDAVTNTTVFVSNSVPTTISSLNVGMVVDYPRISDLAFTLISPSGQRILLMENRGGLDATNAGGVFFITNTIGTVTANGSFQPDTNYVSLQVSSGTLNITYDMFTIPDEMTVYYGTNPATFNNTSGDLLFDSGMVSGAASTNINFGPGTSTALTVIMNQFGNTNNGGSDQWTYTLNGGLPDYNFLTFTEDTNLTEVPIKFAIPPFDLRDFGTNFTFGDLDFATNGDYFGQTNIFDPFGGWNVPTNMVVQVVSNSIVTNNYNEVSVVADPGVAFSGSNYLALGYGVIQRTNLVQPFHLVTFSYDYRGPGIAGWWRGEGDGRDSSDAEQHGQNGSLIGRFNFPAGEVSQSFEMENNGNEYNFAGTNSYVQIRQPPYYVQQNLGTGESNNFITVQASHLDVGTGPGLTVEGWINPTNTQNQMPLVEWLARVPTNGSDTNLTIRAGPFLYRGTDHFYYMLAATNWTTSETWAEQLGGHLATVDTADEQNWIFDTFAAYAGRSRDLWIGLTNFGTNFVYSSGVTNSYTNWLSFQPNNTDGIRNYTFMYGNTNIYPGLWTLADNNGFTFGNPTVTNIVYGVVEVTNLQTNGVQFWISVTNVPGTTNIIMTNTGCLFANLVDASNISHWVYSAPGLVQSNVFQHVALTYDTNSGIANLFYDGTNVASTNVGVFVPLTTGDVLLGKDMSLETNNYYGGEMDEMSIYGRALSDAEIAGIYSVSAYTTNRLVGKFDPTITPPESLAEAQVVLGNMTNTILGANNTWQQGGFTFTPQTNALPLQITGLQPGMLFDSFGIQEAPLGNLYYFPEQSLDQLKGESPNGNWTLEIWNTRNNTLVTNAQIVAWQLQMILQTNSLPPVDLGSQEPTTITVPPGQVVNLAITPPTWAAVATNILDSSTLPLNVWLNTNAPTVGAAPPDTFLFGPNTTGSTNLYAVPTPTPPPNFIPGETYYIGLQNPGNSEASAVFEVDYNITALTNDVPFNDTLLTSASLRYFSFTVSTNSPYETTFQLLKMNGNADLVVSKGTPLPTLTNSDYGSFNSGWANENIYVLTNSMPVPLTPGTWYIGIFNRDTHPVDYTVLVQELDLPPASSTNLTLIQLTNGVPFNFTAGPGAALTNFFQFNVTNTITSSNGVPVTNYVGSIHFELYNLTGNGDLTVQTDAPPFAPPFFQSSDEPGTLPEYIQIRTNSVLTNLATAWYLGVPNESTNLINYTIYAVIDTNGYFPAFPGAEGAGGGALGASWRNGYTNNTVYHVVNLNDSGLGSFRDAVSSTNRTVVFDISGIIYLQSPLVITNSYLTIAGQTAPEGGITVAGETTTMQGVHDVVIRDVRFASGVTTIPLTAGFEMANAGDYTNAQAFAGWTVLTNEVSIVTDPTNTYNGSNFLALADGIISNTLPTIPGNTYRFNFAYRGPGIVSMWLAQSNANDCIGTNNGSISNAVTFVPGKVGEAFNLGTTGFILVPPSSSLDVSSDPGFTIDAWIEPQDVSSTWHPICEWSQDSYYAGPLFHLIGTPPDGGVASLYANVVDSGAAGHVFYTGPNVLTAGIFQHVALSYNRVTGYGSLYLNGILMTNVNLGFFTPWTSGFYFLIGREINNFTPANNHQFDGEINDMSLYGRALSDAEINAFNQKGSAGKYDGANPFPGNLAEAFVTIGTNSQSSIIGSNNLWLTKSITFKATQTGTPVEFTAMEPGTLLSSANLVAVTNAGDSLQLNTVSNVISDHLSILWSSNNDLSILNSSNVTVQWSIISDSLHTALDSGGGSVVDFGGGTVSLHHNLYADNAYANPQLGANISLDFVNNVIYDWGTNSGVSEDDNPDTFTNYLNYIGNYLIASTNSLTNDIAFWGGTTNTWIYQTNNFIDSDTNGWLNGADTRWLMFTNRYTPTNQFRLPPVSVDEAYLAYEKVLDFAGDSMFKRDMADSNIVENVRNQAGVIISASGVLPVLSTSEIYVDSANDGIPDFWKITFGQAVTNAENNTLLDASGYSELEEFDNWLAGPHALTYTNTPVGVNLMKLFGKTGNLSFFLTNAINGSVYLTNVLGSYTNTSTYSNSIAIFTPTNNYSGYASFGVYVTNNDTVAYFGPVTVSVFVSAVPPAFTQPVGSLTNGVPTTNTIGGNTIEWYQINVPTNAVAATNSLLFAGLPMNLWYSTNVPPTTSYPQDFEMLTASTNGSAVININGAPLPPVLQPGGTYYLGVQNTNNIATNYAVEVSFDLNNVLGVTPIGGGSPITNTIPGDITLIGGGTWQYYDLLVPPNAIAATNIILFATSTNGTGNINLWFNQTNTPTGVSTPPDYELIDSFYGTTPGIGSPILMTNSIPPLLPGQIYYLGVQNLNTTPITYALEVNYEYYYTPPVLPVISNVLVVAGNTLTVDDTATDTNAGALFYFLTTAPPVGATITNNGVITWNVPTNEPATNILFTTVVSNSFTAQTATNSFTVTVLPLVTGNNPTQTNTVAAGTTSWLAVQVPVDAEWATNILFYATNSPVNVLFTTNFPPATNTAYTLMLNQSAGTSVLGPDTVPTNIVSGGVYYLGVQNNSAAAVGYALQVTFGLYPPPVLPGISNLVIIAGNTLIVTNTATNAAPGNLVYSLTTMPRVNATISTNGIITWATATTQPPTNVVFTTIVTNSFTTLSATNVFTVTVLPFRPPGTVTFSSIVHTNIGGVNGFLLAWLAPTSDAFQVQQTPSLLPASWQTFTNIITYSGPPTATNGIFTFFDNGSEYPFGPMRYYRLLLLQPNELVLPDLPNYTINVSQPLAVTNTAVDSNPGAALTYNLADFPTASSAPVMNNGIITWTPSGSDAGGAFKFTTIVTDDGLPPASATNDFTVFVLPAPGVASATVTSTNVTLQWTASTNDLFQVEWTANLNPVIVWTTFPQTITSATGSFTFTDTNAPVANRFYRLVWLPLP